MLVAALIALTFAAVSHGQPPPPASDDEARIEALVASEHATEQEAAVRAEEEREEAVELEREHKAEQFPPAPGTRIAFEDLEKMKGRGVRVHTKAGHTRVGVVQEVGKNDVQLRARQRGGYAEYTVARKQIVEIEAE